MRRLIEEDSAAFACPGRSPVARIIVELRAVPGGDEPVRAPDLAVFSTLDKLAHLSVKAVRPLVEHHSENDVGVCLRNGVHLTDLLCIDSRGLLAHHVDLSLHAFDRVFRVVIVRNGDDARVDKTRIEHLDRVCEGRDVSGELLCRLKPLALEIRDRLDLKRRAFSFDDVPDV